jgi:Na+-translocating ferredoxin:NAD+ oxidoreductase subunit B
MSTVLLLMIASVVLSAWALAQSTRRWRERVPPLVERIDALLPQTQCGRCTFQGCKPYAQAIVDGQADTNQCPPGGTATARALAQLLGRPFKPVGAEYGASDQPPLLAIIDEEICIGCALCIDACPTDAIVGASKFMHTVISAHCTGCELCIPVCPVDCIDLRPALRA